MGFRLKQCELRLKTGIDAEINQENVNGVLNSVGDDGRHQVSAGGEINAGEDRAIDDVLDHSGRTLREVSKSKYQRNENRGCDPSGCRSSEHIGDAIQEVPAPNHLFAKPREDPCERDPYY